MYRMDGILSTAGAPAEKTKDTGSEAALEKIWCEEILQFCGIPEAEQKVFYSVIITDDETRRGYLDEAREMGKQL